MTQSSEVSRILDRITQESTEVTQTRKVFAKCRRTPRSPRPQRVQLSIPASPKEPEEQSFDAQWEPIRLCMDSVMDSSGPGQFEPAFHSMEKLCRQGENLELIHHNLSLRLNEFALKICEKLKPPVKLESILATAKHCERVAILLSSVFSVFERAFLFPMTIEKLVTQALKSAINADRNVVSGVCMAIVVEIEAQRQSVIQREMEVASVSPELRQGSEFVELFELTNELAECCAKETASFYGNISFERETPELYLRNVKLVLEKEQTIISPFSKTVVGAVMAQVRKYLYVDKLMRDMNDYVSNLVDMKNMTCLRLMASLIFAAKSPELDECFADTFVHDTSKRVSKALELKGLEVIDELLRIHDSLVVCRSFLSEVHARQVSRGFRAAMNQQSNKIAFMLARYCHSKILSVPEEVISKVDAIMLLFRELDSMDIFMEHHRQFLSIRLLSYTKTPPRVESVLIGQMAVICGDQEVRSMEGMLNDTISSLELNREFDAKVKVSMRFVVMSYESWPQYPNITLKLPSFVLDARSNFTEFYKERQPRRKIQWKTALDDCSFRLNGSLCTGSVMYYLYIEAIVNNEPFEQSGLTDKLEENLLNVLMKHGIVKIVDGQKTISPRIPKKRVMLPIPLAISPRQRTDKTIEDVAWSRKMKVEAAIVLVMKRMRVAGVDTLYEESMRIVNFGITRKDFDAALKSCIEKSYLMKNDEGEILFSPD